MVTSAQLGWTWLALLAGGRGVELAVSSRNARRALARGGIESGRGHYPAMVVLHAAFLVSCAAERLLLPVRWPIAAAAAALAAGVAAQALRWWAIAALRGRWSTRIVVVPGEPPVTGGPYRFLRHPNYLAVAVELAAAPLVFGAWRTALVFSAANAALLAIRIRAEERALGPRWEAAFAGRPRLVPGVRR
jgi:methyltransferase